VSYYEWIGYTGSVLVAISLMMKNIYHLRRINFIGAATFAFYGYLVSAYPVVLLNGFIALVDLYYLVRMNKEKESFSLMPVLDESHPFLTKFLDYYRNDIKKYFPEFDPTALKGLKCFFILRNMMPVGIFIYERTPQDEILIKLDYAIPDYRDHKNGKFLIYAQSKFLLERGVKKMIAVSHVRAHQKYLEKIGFKRVSENQFELEIAPHRS